MRQIALLTLGGAAGFVGAGVSTFAVTIWGLYEETKEALKNHKPTIYTSEEKDREQNWIFYQQLRHSCLPGPLIGSLASSYYIEEGTKLTMRNALGVTIRGGAAGLVYGLISSLAVRYYFDRKNKMV
jgi:hypothetical protein